jgi:hypothetical protein
VVTRAFAHWYPIAQDPALARLRARSSAGAECRDNIKIAQMASFCRFDVSKYRQFAGIACL